MRGIDIISDRIHDETTILAFRYLLELNDFGKQIFEVVKSLPKVNGMVMEQGTIIDASLIAPPCARSASASSGPSGCSRRPAKR